MQIQKLSYYIREEDPEDNLQTTDYINFQSDADIISRQINLKNKGTIKNPNKSGVSAETLRSCL